MIDEVHELPARDLIDIWIAALAKSAEGGILFLLTNTPATSQHTGSYFSELAQRVVSGDDPNDAMFVFIMRVDVADREAVFDNPACWPKAMMALGETFPVENIEREVMKARNNPAEAARVKRLFMGIPTGAVDFWLDDSTMWDRCLGAVDPDLMTGFPCWLALDLSDKHDLTALTMVWAHGDHRFARTLYWTCEANLSQRARTDRMPYDVWAADGHLNVVPGASIDKEFVATEVAQLVAAHDVQFLAFDTAGMAAFEEACVRIGLATWRYTGPDARAGKGLKLMPHAQGTRVAFDDKRLSMPRSIEALEDLIRRGEITIDSNPINTACASNAAPVVDAVGNRAFDKRPGKSRGRIDGLVTLAMGVGASCMIATVKPPPRIFQITL